MIANVTQRWRDRRGVYRPVGEPIDPHRYDVAAIADDTTARRFVERHHYSGSFPAARFRFGLYRGAELVGVAVFSVPAQPRALACLPDPGTSVELGRFVLVDDVPANGETWFLGRAFELLRVEGLSGVVSFSDPIARTAAGGDVVFPGHIGTIYQAHNAAYLGRSKPDTLRLLPDGTAFHRRARSKIAARETGWRYAAARLEAAGAAPLGAHEDAAAWLARWLPRVTRALRHDGNHKYAWALAKRDRRHLPESLPYPKMRIAA